MTELTDEQFEERVAMIYQRAAVDPFFRRQCIKLGFQNVVALALRAPEFFEDPFSMTSYRVSKAKQAVSSFPPGGESLASEKKASVGSC